MTWLHALRWLARSHRDRRVASFNLMDYS